MALILPASNPVAGGESFTGPQTALEILGDHFYGYTGVQSISGTSAVNNMLTFTTGNYYLVGTIDVQGLFNVIGNGNLGLEVKLNDAIVVHSVQSPANDHTIYDTPMPIIIPSYTNLKVGMLQNSGSDIDFEIIMTGRVYR
jgi:hypothetical protein